MLALHNTRGYVYSISTIYASGTNDSTKNLTVTYEIDGSARNYGAIPSSFGYGTRIEWLNNKLNINFQNEIVIYAKNNSSRDCSYIISYVTY